MLQTQILSIDAKDPFNLSTICVMYIYIKRSYIGYIYIYTSMIYIYMYIYIYRYTYIYM